MKTLSDDETGQISGGIPGGPVDRMLRIYADFLQDIDSRPEAYTWMMDWYYRR